MATRKVSKRRLYIEDVAEILGITIKGARRRYEKGSLPKPKREPRNGKPRLYWQPAVMRVWLEEHHPEALGRFDLVRWRKASPIPTRRLEGS